MNKKLFLSLLFIVGIGMGVGMASSLFGVDKLFRAIPVAAKANEEITNEEIAKNPAPLNIKESVASSDNLELETTSPIGLLEGLNARAVESFTAGWLHVREVRIFDQDAENNGVLPNGEAIPDEYIQDTWFHLGKDKVVTEVVSIMRAMDGQIIQVGVISNGTGWNSVTGEVE